MSLQPHIQLSKEMTGARYALLPGDPQRVDRIVKFLDNPQRLGQNREFRARAAGIRASRFWCSPPESADPPRDRH